MSFSEPSAPTVQLVPDAILSHPSLYLAGFAHWFIRILAAHLGRRVDLTRLAKPARVSGDIRSSGSGVTAPPARELLIQQRAHLLLLLLSVGQTIMMALLGLSKLINQGCQLTAL